MLIEDLLIAPGRPRLRPPTDTAAERRAEITEAMFELFRLHGADGSWALDLPDNLEAVGLVDVTASATITLQSPHARRLCWTSSKVLGPMLVATPSYGCSEQDLDEYRTNLDRNGGWLEIPPVISAWGRKLT
jgi:hypothetical protein